MSIDYTLGVASPLVYDLRAKRAQQILNGANVFGYDFLTGSVDGQFGPVTGRACVHAKDWLGYPDKALQPTYGHDLDGYLTGAMLIPDEFAGRQSTRRHRKAALRTAALAQAVRHLGQTESPAGSNHVPWATVWYGMDRQPWCAMAVTRWYVDAGSKSFVRGARYAYVPFIVADARAGRNGLRVTHDPLPGDIVNYDWDGGVADHVGVFDGWVDRTRGYFRAVEGNTAPDDSGSQSNGGGVFRRGERPGRGDTRRLAQVECFARVTR